MYLLSSVTFIVEDYKINKARTTKMILIGLVYFLLMLILIIGILFNPIFIQDLHSYIIPPLLTLLLLSTISLIRRKFFRYILMLCELIYFFRFSYIFLSNLKKEDVGAAGWAAVFYTFYITIFTIIVIIIDLGFNYLKNRTKYKQ